jgi:hypothetical protein
MDITHTSNILFRLGDKDKTYTEKLTVKLTDLDIESTSNQTNNGLIQAGYTNMTLDLNMTGVKLKKWDTKDSVTTGAIVAGREGKTTVLSLTMTDCELDVTEADGAKAIYATDGVTGEIQLSKTKISTNVDTPVYNNQMTLNKDGETIFSKPEAQPVVLRMTKNPEPTDSVKDAEPTVTPSEGSNQQVADPNKTPTDPTVGDNQPAVEDTKDAADDTKQPAVDDTKQPTVDDTKDAADDAKQPIVDDTKDTADGTKQLVQEETTVNSPNPEVKQPVVDDTVLAPAA